jgi:Tol biopolymer transport system component
VKVLDFGLAKQGATGVAGATGAGGATGALGTTGVLGATGAVTSPAVTMQGVILGTAAYMSPEQAKGKLVDKRTDMWAFGCVLFEMLTGRRAFPGQDVSDTLASILAREPDFNALPSGLPPALRALIVRCLARDLKLRVAHASTALYVLTSGLETVSSSPAAMNAAVGPRLWWRRALPAVAAAVAGLVGVAAGAMWPKPPAPKPVTRFSFELPAGQIYTNNNRQMIAVSPDGSRIVFVAGLRLYSRSLADPEARPIPGSDVRAGVLNPTFSPDGQWVAFWSANELRKIPVGGGTPVTLYRDHTAVAALGLTWDEAGIVFPESRGIVRVSPDGGEPVVLVPARDREAIYRPQVLPGGQHVLYTLVPAGQSGLDGSAARIVVQPVGNGDPTALVQGVDGRYLATGHLLYRSDGTVMAARFDPRRLTLESPPVVVAEASASSGNMSLATHYDVSSSGILAYVAGSGTSRQDLVLLDRRGQIVKRLGLPDERRVAYSDRSGDPNVWIADLEGASAPRRLTFSGRNRFPVWSADGQHLAFQSDRAGDQAIYWQRSDGDAEAERLTTPQAGASHAPEAFSPDGDHLLIRIVSGDGASLWSWSRRDRSMQRLDSESPRTSNATFSPDGRWIAYTLSQAIQGVGISIVRPFPPTAARYQLPVPEQGANMAIHPVWSRKTPELLYSIGPGMLATAAVDTRSIVRFAVPSVVQIPGTGDPSVRSWDLTPDGRHIVRVIETDLAGSLSPPINVVLNWTEELNARAAAR